MFILTCLSDFGFEDLQCLLTFVSCISDCMKILSTHLHIYALSNFVGMNLKSNYYFNIEDLLAFDISKKN